MNRILVGLLLLFATIIMGHDFLFAAPPINRGGATHQKPVAFKSCRSMGEKMRLSLQMKGAIRMAGEKALLTATTKKILVIPVQFPGSGPSLPASYLTDAATFFSSMRNYYYENSYTLFTVTATVTTSVTLPKNVGSYNNETDADLTRLFTDATAGMPSPPGAGYSDYDYLMIYHAGAGEEESGDSADLWSMYDPQALNSVGTGPKTFDGFTVVPAAVSAPSYTQLGVICHEFGHQLALPDLYDTTNAGGTSTMGAWSLMDYPYGTDNSGNPPHLDVWSKNFLKYVDLPTRLLSDSKKIEFGDIETAQTTGYYKIPIDSAVSTEYFIAEYRNPDSTRMKYDLTAPGSGIVIWHIDDAIALNATRLSNNDVNSGVPHRGVALVPAAGSFKAPGHPSDAFVAGSSFVSPRSNTFSGGVTDIAIADIILQSGRADASFKKIVVLPEASIDKLTNYPNPSGAGHPHPRSASGVITTVVFQATRPPESIFLDIYTIAGEKVASFNKDTFLLRLDKSVNNKWVYECDWNGKNESNEDVAPGIYLYRVKADTITKTGKLAIIR